MPWPEGDGQIAMLKPILSHHPGIAVAIDSSDACFVSAVEHHFRRAVSDPDLRLVGVKIGIGKMRVDNVNVGIVSGRPRGRIDAIHENAVKAKREFPGDESSSDVVHAAVID